MGTLLIVLTYAAYLFIIVMYSIKARAWLQMPRHMRWDLYPVIHEENYRYGGSYYEQQEWWNKPRHKNLWRSLFYALKDNFYMGEYFKKNRWYWAFLFSWHLGFIFIITFHILCFFGALAMHLGLDVSAASQQLGGRFIYLVLLFTGGFAFISGTLGSMGMSLIRSLDPGLRSYATPFNYFNYFFFFLVSASGLYDWLFVDPTLTDYRTYWLGLLTFTPAALHPATILHIILFDLFLIYLPFTRSLHYITRIFAYFFIRWDDEPNLPGSKLEGQIGELLGKKVSWEGKHIPAGKTWAEAATESGLPEGKRDTP
ncbi:MAG: respiratory nitrate reductase subunit gamma [Smithellaceae bacterium]|nr:respiratory nitrate reductase subunit gamma [Smithellaceae bacterium]